jgi:uncharacterized membrane protein
MSLVHPFLIGVFTGLRTISPIALVARATRKGALATKGPLFHLGEPRVAGALAVAAGLELIADKLPWTPRRTLPPSLIGRTIMGGVAGACLARGGSQIATHAIAGALGGIAGCFGGYILRKQAVERLQTRDLYVALVEDAITIGGASTVISLAGDPKGESPAG